jgi:predicted nucleic acid-binding protein
VVALIDSSVLIAVERGQLELGTLERKGRDLEFAIAAITASELLHGVHRAAGLNRKAKREAFVERLIAGIPVLPFDLTAARIHARVWAKLASQGASVGAHDLMIAATAIAAGGAVATRDQRSFPRIPGLSLLAW